MFDLFSGLVELSPLMVVSRAVVIVAWFLALVQVWHARHSPMANHAFFAALAIVLSEILMIFHKHLAAEYLVYFVSMAQVAMSISFVKIFRWAAHLTEAEQLRIAAMENVMHQRQGLLHTYGSSVLLATVAGVFYFAVVLLEQGH